MNPLIRVDGSIFSWSIGKFLVLFATLLVVVIFSATVIATYHVVTSYLDQAYSRNARVRAMAQANEINQILLMARYELEYLARMPLAPESMRNHLQAKSTEERSRYREIAFYGQSVKDRFVLVNTGTSVVTVPLDQVMGAKFGIFSSRDQLSGKPVGYMRISEPMEVFYPSVHVDGSMSALNLFVLRLTTPVYADDKQYRGQLTLSIDLPRLRDIISLYTSKQSPLFLFPQDGEQKKSFFFDAAGWLLFQSEAPDRQQADLSVDLLRMGLQGDGVRCPGRPVGTGLGQPTVYLPVRERSSPVSQLYPDRL
jgi:hypothetical protein